jgi:hypothetical protein
MSSENNTDEIQIWFMRYFITLWLSLLEKCLIGSNVIYVFDWIRKHFTEKDHAALQLKWGFECKLKI